MGFYKRLYGLWRYEGWRPLWGEDIWYGVGPTGGVMPTHEERVEASQKVSESRTEREAVREVEREAQAEAERQLAGGINPDCGTSCPWPASAYAHRADRMAIEAVRSGSIPEVFAELRERLGPPQAPDANTGWYRCGESWCRVGSWPYPEFRPPDIVWRMRWTAPKPDDVPWEDEVRPRPDPGPTEVVPTAAKAGQQALLW